MIRTSVFKKTALILAILPLFSTLHLVASDTTLAARGYESYDRGFNSGYNTGFNSGFRDTQNYYYDRDLQLRRDLESQEYDDNGGWYTEPTYYVPSSQGSNWDGFINPV